MIKKNLKISICIPSRGRPKQLKRMIDSALKSAANVNRIEFLVYADNDDESMVNFSHKNTKVFWCEHRTISEMTNYLASKSDGSLIMYCADDVIFRSHAWDDLIEMKYLQSKQKTCLIHGDDLGQNSLKIATHGFISRELYELLGYILPELFKSDFCDTWITEICSKSGIRIFTQQLVIEHMHPAWGKADIDSTYRSTNKIQFLFNFLKFQIYWINRMKTIKQIRNYNSA